MKQKSQKALQNRITSVANFFSRAFDRSEGRTGELYARNREKSSTEEYSL